MERHYFLDQTINGMFIQNLSVIPDLTGDRLCIWSPDPDPEISSLSPHPMKLSETIVTGHQANIFSAKYLPNANTPTIVTCAGDRDVRVVEVERLNRASFGMGSAGRYGRGDWGSQELWGVDGPG
jgi:WD and tetratricopeptide repeat-containing protein 1